MWIATVDFKALWTALAQFGIESKYISFLKRPYADQKVTVLTDKESDLFEIQRGTKQGDPLNSLLCNTVLHVALEDDMARWLEKGIYRLTFADDVQLFSASQEQLRSMMCDFKKSTESVGMKNHTDKTKILSNQGSNQRKEATIDNIKVEVLPVSRANNKFRATGDY